MTQQCLNKKWQRKLKLSLIQKHFHNIDISYHPERDVYEAHKNGKRIYAIYAYRPINEIISEISAKNTSASWR